MQLPPTAPVIAILVVAGIVSADYPPYDYSNQFVPTGGSKANDSLDYVAPYPHKYSSWYGDFRAQLSLISTGPCNLSLAAFRGDASARATLGPVQSYCWTHSNCILATITPEISQSIAGASILLGLTPTILSVLGPSVAEMALLSMHRPFLSVLLSLGAPAIFPSRFLVWEDPLRANVAQTGAFVVSRFENRGVAVAITVAEYVLAAGAVANIVDNTVAMGIRAVLVWYCGVSYWPLMWVVLAVVVHTIAVMSLRVAMRRKRFIAGSTSTSVQSQIVGPRSVLQSEFTLSANARTQVRDHYDVQLGPLAVLLQYMGALAALVHLIFGSAMFSSLLFIGNGDAISLVLRFMISAVVCRVILQFEIGGMIKVGKERKVFKGIVQPLAVDSGVDSGDSSIVELRETAKGTK